MRYQAEQKNIYNAVYQGDQWKTSGSLEQVSYNKSCQTCKQHLINRAVPRVHNTKQYTGQHKPGKHTKGFLKPGLDNGPEDQFFNNPDEQDHHY